jgi:hypothetical protein
MNINTRSVSKVFVLNKETNQFIDKFVAKPGMPLILGNYADYEASTDKENVEYRSTPEYFPSTREIIQTIAASDTSIQVANDMHNEQETTHLSVFPGDVCHSYTVAKIIHYLMEDNYSYIVCEEDHAICGDSDSSGYDIIGYVYHEEYNAFIPPCPMEGYLLDESTFTWGPDPEKTYDLHGDGKHYRYDSENNCWWPTWNPEPEQ